MLKILDKQMVRRSGVVDDELELVHGPGCPVCVTSLEMIDKAHAIAQRPDVIFCSFGDMLRVPGSKDDLLILKSRGADVRVVYSPIDCLKIARANPEKRVVFFAIGFETTAPANAMSSLLPTAARTLCGRPRWGDLINSINGRSRRIVLKKSVLGGLAGVGSGL